MTGLEVQKLLGDQTPEARRAGALEGKGGGPGRWGRGRGVQGVVGEVQEVVEVQVERSSSNSAHI